MLIVTGLMNVPPHILLGGEVELRSHDRGGQILYITVNTRLMHTTGWLLIPICSCFSSVRPQNSIVSILQSKDIGLDLFLPLLKS